MRVLLLLAIICAGLVALVNARGKIMTFLFFSIRFLLPSENITQKKKKNFLFANTSLTAVSQTLMDSNDEKTWSEKTDARYGIYAGCSVEKDDGRKYMWFVCDKKTGEITYKPYLYDTDPWCYGVKNVGAPWAKLRRRKNEADDGSWYYMKCASQRDALQLANYTPKESKAFMCLPKGADNKAGIKGGCDAKVTLSDGGSDKQTTDHLTGGPKGPGDQNDEEYLKLKHMVETGVEVGRVVLQVARMMI